MFIYLEYSTHGYTFLLSSRGVVVNFETFCEHDFDERVVKQLKRWLNQD